MDITSSLIRTPGDSGDNTIAAAAVCLDGYHIPAGTSARVAAVITRKIAGHGVATTQCYFHTDRRRIKDAGEALNRILTGLWSPNGPQNSAQ